MGYALKKETFSPRANRLFSRNSHQGFRRFFGLSHWGIGLRSPRRHWRKRIFLRKLALDSRYHGMWGSGDLKSGTWAKFKPMLDAKGLYRIKVVDYSTNNLNAASFDRTETREILKIAMTEAIGELNDDGIAAQKVDIVTHSMGGLVVRYFCATNPDACKRSIRKPITIDAPHTGSELANLVVETHAQPQSRCYNVLPKIEETGRRIWTDAGRTTLAGAHTALSVGSTSLGALASSSLPVPLITAIGQTQIGFQPVRFAYNEGINTLWQGLWFYCGKVPDSSFFEYFGLLDTMFPEGGNDRIVSALSQLGHSTELKEFFDVDHVTILEDQKAVDWVRERLERQP